MAEFDMIIKDTFASPMEFVQQIKTLEMINTIPILPTRVPKVYNERTIIPFFYREEEDGTELLFKREIREWDVILPFGSNSSAPRKTPTEINYKGKKLKNNFL